MTPNDHAFPRCDALECDVDGSNIASALNALKPNERAAKSELFQKHFESIEAALARKVSKANVIATLANSGLKLSANTFNKMLASERKRRDNHNQIGETKGDLPPNPYHDESQEAAP